ncbi:UDP-N-acetyl-alpha-D-galactosamine:polypeptide N-acetylgalactosaminyltransferase-like 2 precursor [Anopheles sinensis]|uniref:UDP-N-acetyl-alpha-D-galactosamine:polypeptide N-acetylgalactosaminyltransferase-like 2 n=1 Tax=Anopheles sinensis TaxID=74873 RepID=A0A084VS97_ANOSI|nr:UDP-N-acetyl-alpha-D-galactosamine:polypeptide N-acetylgalactosaminyltransferase-like 2 precursor [Anopheles sinensis]
MDEIVQRSEAGSYNYFADFAASFLGEAFGGVERREKSIFQRRAIATHRWNVVNYRPRVCSKDDRSKSFPGGRNEEPNRGVFSTATCRSSGESLACRCVAESTSDSRPQVSPKHPVPVQLDAVAARKEDFGRARAG